MVNQFLYRPRQALKVVSGLSSDSSSSQGISEGGGSRQQGRYVKSKLQKIASFIVVESLGVPPEHTHVPPAALILPEEFRG